MGFFKKLGRVAKGALKIAAVAGIAPPGLGALAPIIASKMKSAGVKRRNLKDAHTALDAKRRLYEDRKLAVSPIVATSSIDPRRAPAPPARRMPPSLMKLKGSAAALLAEDKGRAARAGAFRRGQEDALAKAGQVDTRIGKLSPGQKAYLADEYLAKGGRKGDSKAFRAFLATRL